MLTATFTFPQPPQNIRFFFGPKQFDLMKKDSYFIAVSRGGIYDMPSLVKSLDSKKLAGAGVDVTDPEPLPQGVGVDAARLAGADPAGATGLQKEKDT